MIYETIQAVRQFLRRRRKETYLIGIPIGIFLLAQIQVVYIHVDTSQVKSNDQVVYQQTSGGNHKIHKGLNVFLNNVSGVLVTAGDQAREYIPLRTPWYRFSIIVSTPTYAHDADKVAYQNIFNTNCSTYDIDNKTLFSYNCANAINLAHYVRKDSGRWANEVTSSLLYVNKTAVPYRGGVLGISRFSATDTTLDQGAITHVRTDGQATSYPLPKGIPSSRLGNMSVMTHFTDPTDSRFVLMDATDGAVYVATIKDGAVRYTKHSAPEKYPAGSLYQTICRPVTSEVVCYRGVKPVGHGSDHTGPSTAYLSRYPYGDKDGDDVKIANKAIYYEQFYATDDGIAYGVRSGELYRFDHSWFDYKQILVTKGVSGVSAGKHLQYVHEKGLYRLEDAESSRAQLVFFSPNITPLSAFVVADTSYVLGRTTGATSSTYAYKLKADRYDGERARTIDLLPAKPSVLKWATEQYLVGDHYHADLLLPIDKSSTTPIDESLYESRQQDVLRKLKGIGVDTDTLKITFGY